MLRHVRVVARLADQAGETVGGERDAFAERPRADARPQLRTQRALLRFRSSEGPRRSDARSFDAVFEAEGVEVIRTPV